MAKTLRKEPAPAQQDSMSLARDIQVAELSFVVTGTQ
jgi:hypothetical protein